MDPWLRAGCGSGVPDQAGRWHLDELVVRIAGRRMYLWRAVDHEDEILDVLVQRRRDKRAPVKLMRTLLKRQGFAPRLVVTDKLRSHAAAFTISALAGGLVALLFFVVGVKGASGEPDPISKFWPAVFASTTADRRELLKEANARAPPLRNQKFADSPLEGD